MSRSTTSDLLTIAFGKLVKHQDLIQQAYLAGSFRRDGSKNDRGAFELLQHRIFIPGGKDTYLLSGPLTRFLDEITQRQRAYDLLGDKASAQVERISNLVDGYRDAVMSGKAGDADAMIDEFHTACAELSGTFSSGISRLLHLAETNFAVVSSVKAKSRQNEHYLKQAKFFRDALSALESTYVIEKTIDHLYCDGDALRDAYRTLILDRKIEWNTEILRLIQFFESYLYRLRDLAPDVKRFRQFAGFLEQNPGYEPPDLEDTHHRPQWMMRDAGFSPVAYADPGDRRAFDYLAGVVSSLPEREEPVPRRVKEAGRIERDVDKAAVVYRPPTHQIALRRLAKAAARSDIPLSALEWKREHYPELDIPDDIWLHLILDMKDSHASGLPLLSYKRVERRGKTRISRNLFVTDVMLYGR